MANASRQNQFDTDNTLTEAALEGEFDYIYDCLNGTNGIDVDIKGDLEVEGGNITLTAGATDVDIINNNSSALSFDASGQAGILEIDSQTGATGVNITGFCRPDTLRVTGAEDIKIYTYQDTLDATDVTNGYISLTVTAMDCDKIRGCAYGFVTVTGTDVFRVGEAAGNRITQVAYSHNTTTATVYVTGDLANDKVCVTFFVAA
ncbi:MAG: hypothetical protein ABIJ08_00760 [Nanoarchaeota archaeon]